MITPETITVFPGTVARAVARLKNRLQRDYELAYPDLGEIVRLVIEEEEANAWKLSPFPHLFLPDLVEAHITQLGLQPAETRHHDILTPSFGPPFAYAAAC